MSRTGKRKEVEQSLYKKLEIKGLAREARAQVLLAAYLEYPAEISHQRRLRDLALRTGQTYNALLQVATRRGWKEALYDTQSLSDTTEAGVIQVTAVEEVNRTFSALQMATGIKKYAQLASEVCTSFSKVTQRLVSLWARRIDYVLDGINEVVE
jgi:hypothetical protein